MDIHTYIQDTQVIYGTHIREGIAWFDGAGYSLATMFGGVVRLQVHHG